MTDNALVLLTHDGPVSTLTVNREKALNALDRGTLEALGQALAELASRSELRCLIVTGVGERAFVAGADISAMRDMSPKQAEEFARLGQSVFASLEALPVPVIAAVNGFCLGGGCELALACDFIYASNKAKFGQPEVKLGILPGFGGTQRLPRRVGPGLARDLIYTGRMLAADEALRAGLCNVVVPRPELMARVREAADQIAGNGPLAIAAAKRVMNAGAHLELGDAISLEAKAFGGCFESEDQREGMGAFLEKREPVFKAR